MLPEHLPRYPAPAKLNLNLHIIGRRKDGYHELESIFTLINWQDTLCIQVRHDQQIVLHTPITGVLPEYDLTVRAAMLLQKISGSLKGADIWLDKQLPMGGGLGGGSSDAATVLMVLNHLWQCQLSQDELIRLGATLGADVPFFIFGQTAFVRGIGERLQAMAIPEQWYIVVKPNVHVATPKIFAHPNLTRNSPSIAHPNFQALQPFRNDMQPVVLQEYPEVKLVFECLRQYGQPLMTGSGACIFLTFPSEIAAKNVAQRLPETLFAKVVKGMDVHPLRVQIMNQ